MASGPDLVAVPCWGFHLLRPVSERGRQWLTPRTKGGQRYLDAVAVSDRQAAPLLDAAKASGLVIVPTVQPPTRE